MASLTHIVSSSSSVTNEPSLKQFLPACDGRINSAKGQNSGGLSSRVTRANQRQCGLPFRTISGITENGVLVEYQTVAAPSSASSFKTDDTATNSSAAVNHDTESISHTPQSAQTSSDATSKPDITKANANVSAVPFIPEQARQATPSVPRWQISVTYMAGSTTNLGKKRHWVHRLDVPSEANRHFDEIKESLEASVNGFLTNARSRRPILWSTRLCMVGLKADALITAEPTILISCSSAAAKRDIKKGFKHNRPYYLEGLGMNLIIKYDKSAPVFAGIVEDSADHGDPGENAGAIRIQRDYSSTSCGLKVLIESYSTSGTCRAYATIGGVIKLCGTWYGITAAHPILNILSNSTTDVSDDGHDSPSGSENSSTSDNDSDEAASLEEYSTDDRPIQSSYNSMQVGCQHNLQNKDFIRLAGVWPGGFMSYSFDGTCRTTMRPISADLTISDWAILEVPEIFIRSNIYNDIHKADGNGSAKQTAVTSITNPSELVSGLVYVLCDAENPPTGHLSLNFVSIQLDRGSVEVYEVFLDKPIINGISGSWVVRSEQLVGMVVAVSNRGTSCLILPMWKVFHSIQAVCQQEPELYSSKILSLDTSSSDSDLSKQPAQVRFSGSEKRNKSATSASKQSRERGIDQYHNLFTRTVESQELISKTVANMTARGSIMGPLEHNERFGVLSTLFPDPADDDGGTGYIRANESASQASTLVHDRSDNRRNGNVYTDETTSSQNQPITLEAFWKFVKSPTWKAHTPATLIELLDAESSNNAKNTSRPSSHGIELSGATLECFDISQEGVISQAYIAHKINNTISVLAAMEKKQQNVDHSAGGQVFVLNKPSALQLAAVHMALAKDFDMGQILQILTDDAQSKAYMKGYLDAHVVRQRSFVFSFKYHCIVEDGYEPPRWRSQTQMPFANNSLISSCSAVVALSLSDSSTPATMRTGLEGQVLDGHVFDPLGPWKMLQIEHFPDSLGVVQDSDFAEQKLRNGPEAFVIALLNEYQNANLRCRKLQLKVSHLVLSTEQSLSKAKPNHEESCAKYREDLFQHHYRARQVLNTMDLDIHGMINAYVRTFNDAVWKGEHKYIWPGLSELSSDRHSWAQKMVIVRKELEHQIAQLDKIRLKNEQLRTKLEDSIALFLNSLTVEESRRSIASSKQLRILSIVSFVYLPLYFAVSHFVMNIHEITSTSGPIGLIGATIVLLFPILVAGVLLISRLRTVGSYLASLPLLSRLARKQSTLETFIGLGVLPILVILIQAGLSAMQNRESYGKTAT